MTGTLIFMDFATRILIVDDDEGIRTLISTFLEKHGFHTSVASSAAEMREVLARQRQDLVVLDVMMPKEDGLTALRGLQGADAPPVIMLSAVGTDIDRIIGLEIGAQDYLAKPCNPRELLARIRTVLRRREQGSVVAGVPVDPSRKHRTLRFDGWSLDIDAFLVLSPEGKVVPFTDGEFRLLRALVEHPLRVLTRDQLLDYSRGEAVEAFDRAVDVQVSRLRRKLATMGGGGNLIRTVRNEGYMFTAAVSRH